MAAAGFGAFVAATYANQAYVKEGEAWTRVQVGDLLYSTHPLSLSANDLTVMHGKVTHSRISPFLSFTKA